jgi:D-beta-D-heptose 7-phosphate kinase/D-beta-D-heptose 1-phosphate adenosyltransferase
MVATVVGAMRSIGYRIVLTQGTFDLFHVGHSRYIRKAKEYGDILVVGVDDDEKARGRKGENRPVVPLVERMEVLADNRAVDLVAVKRATDSKWQLIKAVSPDVLIAVEGTYTEDEIASLREFCGEVVVLPRQAETSTSNQVRRMVLDGAETLTSMLSESLPALIATAVRSSYEAMRGKS